MVIVGFRLELMSSESLLAQFDALLPLAAAWATKQEQAILHDGVSLSAEEIGDARAIAATEPDRMCRDSDYSLATRPESLFYAGGSLAFPVRKINLPRQGNQGFEANWRYCVAPGARSPIMTVIST